MDVSRRCFTAWMRFFPGEGPTQVRWYRCAADSRVFPGYHRYGLTNWTDNDWFGDQSIGEDPDLPMGYSKSPAPPRATGQHFCGTLLQWQQLNEPIAPVQVDCYGVPACCGPFTDEDCIFLEDDSGDICLENGEGCITLEEEDVAYYPQRWTCWHSQSIVTNGNPLLQSGSVAGAEIGVASQSPPANGDAWTNGCFLKAGTYDFTLVLDKFPSGGILDIYIDGVLAVAGIDTYNAATQWSQFITNSVTITGDGYHVIAGVVNGKNAASSDYYIEMGRFWFAPAADTEDHS